VGTGAGHHGSLNTRLQHHGDNAGPFAAAIEVTPFLVGPLRPCQPLLDRMLRMDSQMTRDSRTDDDPNYTNTHARDSDD
jgi:hypothetical protein